MQVYRSSAYPIVFQPYTLTIHITNPEEDNQLKAIFNNSGVISKALTSEGYEDRDMIRNFIDEINEQLED
jgi:hypothetical protein